MWCFAVLQFWFWLKQATWKTRYLTGNANIYVPTYRSSLTLQESDDIAEGDIAGLTPEPDDSQMITGNSHDYVSWMLQWA